MTSNNATNENIAEYNILENIKENIEPQRQGRSATSIARVFQIPANELRPLQVQQRNDFESLISNCEDLDDPLEAYVDYIKWINDNFPEGPNSSNGLISVMELCTNYFKDSAIYKNDPRYLKVWIQYSKYSENPTDVFVFLYRKEIGILLSLYYEEYARILENSQQYEQANQVFQKGLLAEAKPSKRLETKYNQFRIRVSSIPTELIERQEDNEPFEPFPERQALSLKSGSLLPLTNPDDHEDLDHHHNDEESDFPIRENNDPHMGSLVRNKLTKSFSIYSDTNPSGLNNPFEGNKLSVGNSFGTIAERTKENKLPAKPWAGETLPQDINIKNSKEPKISVFKDHDLRKDANIPVYKVVETINATTGQINISKLDINLDLLHPPETGQEYCLNEVLALMRGNYSTKKDILSEAVILMKPQQEEEDKQNNATNDDDHSMCFNDKFNSEMFRLQEGSIYNITDDEGILDEVFQKEKAEDNILGNHENSIINNSMNSLSSQNNKSPTVTMFTKEANNEISKMFKNKSSLFSDENNITVECSFPSSNGNIERFKKKLMDGRVDHDEEYTVDNIEEFTEHTKHNDIIKKFSKKKRNSRVDCATSPPKALHDDELDKLENDVAELSMLEHDEIDANNNHENASNDSSPFLSTPVKRPLSNKGTPFIIKKLKNDNQLVPIPSKKLSQDTISTVVIDPFEEQTKSKFVNMISASIKKCKDYHGYSSSKSTFKSLKLLSNSGAKKYNNKFINFDNTNELYNIKKKLGEGGYGMVFLIESSIHGKLDALKVETPASIWEFYIIHVIKQRIIENIQRCNANSEIERKKSLIHHLKNSMVNAKRIHCYNDESYLILDYLPQGSLLDILNMHKQTTGKPIDEVLAIFFTIQIIKLVELLHFVNVIHGDLKPDNLMINFTKVLAQNTQINTKNDIANYLDAKCLTLIDFGRAIDLQLIDSPEYLFKTELTSIDPEQDCPQIEKNETWKFEIDYFGIANIIHSMLFGEYIQLNFENGAYKLKNKLKRYWQTDIWSSVFTFLLNPNNSKISTSLKDQRVKLERFLYDESNNYKNISFLQQIIFDIEYSLQNASK